MFWKVLIRHLFTFRIRSRMYWFRYLSVEKKYYHWQTNRQCTLNNRKKNLKLWQCKVILCQIIMSSIWALRWNECEGFTYPCAHFADRKLFKTRLAYAVLWIVFSFKKLTPALLPPLYLQGLYYINTHYKHTVYERLPWQDVNQTCVYIILQSKSLYLM